MSLHLIRCSQSQNDLNSHSVILNLPTKVVHYVNHQCNWYSIKQNKTVLLNKCHKNNLTILLILYLNMSVLECTPVLTNSHLTRNLFWGISTPSPPLDNSVIIVKTTWRGSGRSEHPPKVKQNEVSNTSYQWILCTGGLHIYSEQYH